MKYSKIASFALAVTILGGQVAYAPGVSASAAPAALALADPAAPDTVDSVDDDPNVADAAGVASLRVGTVDAAGPAMGRVSEVAGISAIDAPLAGVPVLAPGGLAFTATVSVGSTRTLTLSVNNVGDSDFTVDDIQTTDPHFLVQMPPPPELLRAQAKGGGPSPDGPSVLRPAVTYPIGYGSVTTPTNGPAGYSQCSTENGICVFTGLRNVAYGANGTFAYLFDATSPVSCSNAVFGDPLVGTVKACYVSPAPISGPTYLNIPVAFAPTDSMPIVASLIVTTSAGVVTATLSGTGDISAKVNPDALAFPVTLIGGHSGREVYVYHSDPGSLLITGVRTDDPQFTMTGELGLPFNLPADFNYNWYKITVRFAPDAAGPITSTGYITTSAGVRAIQLSGSGAIPAPYALSTAAISASMYATQTSVTRPFVITNTGSITIQVNTSAYPAFDPGVALGRIAYVHSHGVTQAGAILSAVLGTSLIVSVTGLDLADGIPTVDQLHQYDALLIGGVPPAQAALFGNRLYEYVNQGGGVVLAGGALRSDQCIQGWFSLANALVWWPHCANILTNITETLSIGHSDLTHPALRGVNTFRRPQNGRSAYNSSGYGAFAYTDYPYILAATDSWSPTYGEDVPRVDLNFDPVFTDCGDTCGWDGSTDGARLMANALRLTMQRRIMRSGTSVAVGPGKTATPTVTLYGQVVSGTNYGEIHLAVDGQYRQTMPVTLAVQGPPSWIQSNTSVPLGNVYVGMSTTFTPFIDNRGATSIQIYSVTVTMPYVRLEQVSSAGIYAAQEDESMMTVVRPWSRRQFSIIYEPLTPGAHSGVITFTTSVGNKVISLSGASAHDIEVRAEPASVFITSSWGLIYAVPYTLTNLSVVTAWYTLTESSVAITLTGGLTGTLGAGEARPNAFTATLNTGAVLPGLYNNNLLLGQSDPYNAAERTGDAYPFNYNVIDRYLSASPASFIYTNAVLGVPLTRTFTLTNQGNVSLTVTGLPVDSPDWTTSAALPFTLTPGARSVVTLTYIPSSEGPTANTLTIVSDAPQARSIALSATVVLTPALGWAPASITETILDDELRLIPITISNTGQGNLNFAAVSGGGTLLTLTAPSGIVAPGASARMTATIVGTAMTIGTQYHWPITITSNDPAMPVAVIPVTATDSGLPQPAGLVAPANGASSVSADVLLDWTKPTAATGVRFFHWASNETPPATSQFTGTGATTAYNPPGFLRESQPYFWRTETYNAYGSTPGPVWTFTTEQRIDLVMASVVAPDYAWSGGSIGVNWVVSNTGHLTATGTWVDKVYLSAFPFIDVSAVLLGQRNNISALGPGQAYASSGTYVIPTGTEGLRYILVKTDGNAVFGGVREYTGNNAATGEVMTITLTPPPDLQATSVVVPSDALSQQTIQVLYIVSNTSAITLPATAWVDRVYLSTDAVFSVDDTLMTTVNQNRSLAPGAAYTGTPSITLPKGISGTRYAIVYVDASNAIFEHTGDGNNLTASIPINVLLRPPPDLQVTGVSIPATGSSGQPYTVVYTIYNAGPGDTDVGAWTDRIDRNQAPDHTVAPVTLASVARAGILAAGDSYVVTRTFTLPNGVTGNYYVHVAADVNDQVYEHLNESNNWGSSAPIAVDLGPAPDLAAEGASLLSEVVITRGRYISLTWTVSNLGESTAVASWVDRVQLRRLSDNGSYKLADITRPGALAAGGRYTQTRNIKVGSGVTPGDYAIRIILDAGADIYENGRESNNTADAPVTLTVVAAPVTENDLFIDQPGAAGALASSQPITLTWRVTNALNTTAGTWHDKIWLRDCDGQPCADTLLVDRIHSGALAEDAGYLATAVASLPNGISGPRILVFTTDTASQVNDIDRLDNTIELPITVTLSPWPNLRPRMAPILGSGLGGDQWYRNFTRAITWSVENAGAATASGGWADRIYLSIDTTLDAGDKVLATVARGPSLAPGGAYTATFNATAPASVQPGSYYLLIKTDYVNDVFENTDEGDNVAVGARVTITLPPPPDLVVSGVNFTQYGNFPGDVIVTSWTLANAGIADVNVPSLCNLVYLSADATWDIGDALVGERCAATTLSMGEAVSRSLTARMPSVGPGSYTLIVRTDTRFALAEADEGNNTAASATTVNIDIPVLTLGISVTGQMTTGDVRDFRVDAPAGVALEVSLDSAAILGSNEVYVRYGAPATRAVFDYLYSTQGSPDQRVVAPYSQAGSYYIRIYVGSGHASTAYSLLARVVPFAVDSAAPNRVGNAGPSTLDVRGTLFTTGTLLALLGPGGAAVTASVHSFVDAGRIFATFNLAGAVTGMYDLRAVKGGETATLVGAVAVITGTGGRLQTSLDVPADIRYHELRSTARAYSTLYIRYANVGDGDLSAPVFWVESPERALLGLDSVSDVRAQTVHAIGLGVGGRPGILRPGESGSVPVLFSAQRPTRTFTFDLWYITDLDARPLGWPAFANDIQPVGVSDPDWLAALPAVRLRLGETWGSYDRALAAEGEAQLAQGFRTTSARELLRRVYLEAAGVPRRLMQGTALDTLTGAPLVGETVLAAKLRPGINITDAIESIASAKVDALGQFTVELYSSGVYSVAAQNVEMVGPVSVTVPVSGSVQGVVISATKLVGLPSRGSGPADYMIESPQVLVVEGKPHLVFASQGQIYHTWDDGAGWSEAVPIGEGGSPRLVYAPNLLNGTEPGLALFWREGITNSARIMNAAAKLVAGLWQWSNPIVYHSGPVGSGAPNVALDETSAPILAWLMKDWANPADDTDIYYARAPMTTPVTYGKIVGQARLTKPYESELGRLPEGTLVNLYVDGSARALPAGPEKPGTRVHVSQNFTYNKDGWLPVPVIGGSNEISMTGNVDILVDDDEANVQASIGTGAEFMDKKVEGSAAVTARAHWRLDPNKCRYLFDYAQLSGNLSVAGKFPWPGLTAATGTWWGVTPFKAAVNIIVGGDLDINFRWTWNNSAYSHYQGSALLRGTLGVGGELKLWSEDDDSVASAEVIGSGTVELQYTRYGLRYCGYNLHAEASASILWGWYSWNYTWDYPDDQQLVADDCTLGTNRPSRDVPARTASTSAFTATKAILPGSGAVYGANALVADVSIDLANDSTPVLVKTLAGVMALWTHASEQPLSELGNTVRSSFYTTTAWTAPQPLTGSTGFNHGIAVATATDGSVVAAWLRAPSVSLNYADSLNDLITATRQTDIAWATWSAVGGWSGVSMLGLEPGERNGLTLIADPAGPVHAAWFERLDQTVLTQTLRFASWGGSGWTVPVVVAQAPPASAPQIALMAGGPRLIWSQYISDTDSTPSSYQASRLFASTFVSDTWQTPAQLNIRLGASQPAAMNLARPNDNDQTIGGTTWELNFEPPACEAKDTQNPDHPDGPPNASTALTPTVSHDPNDITGPLGFGEDKWIARAGRYAFSIRFENDATLATGPAQRVVITQPLDSSIDEGSFRLGEFGFGDQRISVPANRSYYSARLGPYAIEVLTGTTRTLMVDVLAGIDVVSHQAYWIFQTVDGATGGPPSDALMGFLPPDYLDGNGQGFVSYNIMPGALTTTGAQIAARAFIRFDDNDIIPTNIATNTIDASPPRSKLAALPVQSKGVVTLTWAANDDGSPLSKAALAPGSGLRDVAVYVSANGGPFGLWQSGLITPSAVFSGTPGVNYTFYTLASDNAGLVETGKGISEASTLFPGIVPRAFMPAMRR